MENYALEVVGATAALKELMGARADDLTAKKQMYDNISMEGFVSQSEIKSDPENKVTLKTVDALFLGAGIKTDLINSSMILPITAYGK